MPVTDGGPPRPGEDLLPAGWVYYRDPSGFHVGVPATWMFSSIDSMRCFRDTTNAKAIAVYPNGNLKGHPTDLLAQGEAAWRQAAGLSDYDQVSIKDLRFDEGGADLEYTYTREGLALHGVNRMMRLDGKLFTVCWLTEDLYWPTDRYLRDIM